MGHSKTLADARSDVDLFRDLELVETACQVRCAAKAT